jgi:hypothetical protein
MENTEENSEKIGKIREKSRLNKEMIWKIRKKSRLKFLPYFPYFTFQLTFLPYFSYLFTNQLTFLPYFPYHFTIHSTKIWKKSKLKCEIWKIWKKSKLNSEKIGKILKKYKLNSEMIWKIMEVKKKAEVKARLLTGTYMLKETQAKFSRNTDSKTFAIWFVHTDLSLYNSIFYSVFVLQDTPKEYQDEFVNYSFNWFHSK